MARDRKTDADGAARVFGDNSAARTGAIQPPVAVDLSRLPGIARRGAGVAPLQRRRGELARAFGQEGETTVVLRNHEWNHVVWEIGNVARDKVTGFEISSLMSGHEPEAADVLTYDLDHLELQQVEPDYIEGWDVWPGRIAYSHTGYQSGATKSAIASGLKAREFRLIDQATGKAVLSKAVQTGQNAPRGISSDGLFRGPAKPVRTSWKPGMRARARFGSIPTCGVRRF